MAHAKQRDVAIVVQPKPWVCRTSFRLGGIPDEMDVLRGAVLVKGSCFLFRVAKGLEGKFYRLLKYWQATNSFLNTFFPLS